MTIMYRHDEAARKINDEAVVDIQQEERSGRGATGSLGLIHSVSFETMADRTAEFMALARAVPHKEMSSLRADGQQQQTSGEASATMRPQNARQQQNPALAELRNFRMTASEISRDVSTTSTLLAELSRLVKTGGNRMFADEVRREHGLVDSWAPNFTSGAANERSDALVLRIKTNIEGLHSRLEDASRTLDRSKRRLGKNSQAGQEASNLCGQLKEEFVKTTSGFKAVLEERSDGMKDTNDRKRRVIGDDEGGGEGERVDLMTLMNKPAVYNNSSDQRSSSFGSDGMGMPSIGGSNNAGGMPTLDLTSGMMAMAQRQQDQMSGGLPAGESSSQLPRPHGIVGGGFGDSGLRLRHQNSSGYDSGMPTFSGGASSYYPDSHHQPSVPLTPMEIQQMESQQGGQQQYQLIPDQNYLRQRADAMSQVESNIVELGTIFNKLAVMVNEHRDMVQRVEDNVEDANATINLSMATLTDTLQSLQTNRMLAAKVLGILVLFIIFFIIFFA
ncbi:hypothetical protein THAOC_22491 [Thalassiosira oceanica]|uniref:t-SNARE coiled-coil homology domain-containing protein n=1 Tax=Thalassiosira oceanica TaxID=159749 RepID=K0RUC7_THAOC|nr:hypothetical protein THAOC_22491 [Thalassiosira oceanica]|eukprot:EJK57463.1 hypothetical protein THAOC_22491 [Thalassiosira oceanica]